ncbi:hypothetical protein A167_00778 [Alcanivorax sp. S71-1-4]|uniref:universal stress protein n=1 Tax=Alcanivorax sp. S71-1-4 TaxID=1177159 RepID=UPI001357694A|nr:universal stress protein [Alcanivorax sp. S71-1-4]KAF0810498.1 hypothetical protein A167_00778 [Alcanivorax sp. S71-1-4]
MFSRLLVVLSGDGQADQVLLARAALMRRADSQLCLWRPVRSPLGGLDYRFLTPELRQQVRHRSLATARAGLEELAASLRAEGWPVHCALSWLEKDAAASLHETACQQQASLILMRRDAGALSSDLRHFLRLENLRLAQQACLWLIDTGNPLPPRRLIAALDTGAEGTGCAAAERLTRHAAALALRLSMPLELLTVVPQLSWLGEFGDLTHAQDDVLATHSQRLEALRHLAAEQGSGVPPEAHLCEGDAGPALVTWMSDLQRAGHNRVMLMMGCSQVAGGLSSFWRSTVPEKVIARVGGDVCILPVQTPAADDDRDIAGLPQSE